MSKFFNWLKKDKSKETPEPSSQEELLPQSEQAIDAKEENKNIDSDTVENTESLPVQTAEISAAPASIDKVENEYTESSSEADEPNVEIGESNIELEVEQNSKTVEPDKAEQTPTEKVGFFGKLKLLKHNRLNLFFKHSDDVIEAAETEFYFDEPQFKSEDLRRYRVLIKDRMIRNEIGVHFHPLKYTDIKSTY